MSKPPFRSLKQADTHRTEFLKQIDVQPFSDLFDQLPGVFLFIQDTESRFISANRALLDRLGLDDVREVVGTSDYDYFPRRVADVFVRNDQKVMQTGEPMLNYVEAFYNEQHILDWCVTNKVALRNRRGKVVGIIGTGQTYEGKKENGLSVTKLERAVAYIREHLDSPLKVRDIARSLGTSERDLRANFHQVYGMNVRDFIMRSRINTAAQLLKSGDLPLVEIADACGFCDQSAFTRNFRRVTSMTPLHYRQRYRS